MSIESQALTSLAKSELPKTIAKQLWPTMLFLVVMSIIALVGAKWWSTSSVSSISIEISYWLWFLSMLTITGFGVYVFILDARIQLNSNKSQAQE